MRPAAATPSGCSAHRQQTVAAGKQMSTCCSSYAAISPAHWPAPATQQFKGGLSSTGCSDLAGCYMVHARPASAQYGYVGVSEKPSLRKSTAQPGSAVFVLQMEELHVVKYT